MIKDFISLIFPNQCIISGEPLVNGEKYISTFELLQLPKSELESYSLQNKFSGKVQVNKTYAYFKYSKSGKVQRILHEIKYKNNPELGVMLGNWFGADLVKLRK